MEKELQNHLSDEEMQRCFDWNVKDNEKEFALNHIQNCTYCADRFANFIPLDVEPPSYLEDEILDRVGQMHITLERKVKQTSKKVQLFLYSLKVAFAISASIAMLFICVGSYHEIGIEGKNHMKDDTRNTILIERPKANDKITNALNKFADDYLSPY